MTDEERKAYLDSQKGADDTDTQGAKPMMGRGDMLSGMVKDGIITESEVTAIKDYQTSLNEEKQEEMDSQIALKTPG